MSKTFNIQLNKVKFENSNLLNSAFDKTSLNNIDLTTCDISGMSIGINDIRGVEVTALQGLELAGLLGIIIK